MLLISTVSAMLMAGPRVLQVMGQDFEPLRKSARINEDGIPSTAIYIQSLSGHSVCDRKQPNRGYSPHSERL